METTNEIKGAVKNIQYYVSRVKELSRQQLNKDVEKGHLTGINTGPGSIRFDSLGCIDSAAELIEVYCENILNNVVTAENQDKELWVDNKEE